MRYETDQPRYDADKGIYRDCKWCEGKGCLACPGEADKAYKAAFPDGPKPIATFPNTPEGIDQAMKLAMSILPQDRLPNTGSHRPSEPEANEGSVR